MHAADDRARDSLQYGTVQDLGQQYDISIRTAQAEGLCTRHAQIKGRFQQLGSGDQIQRMLAGLRCRDPIRLGLLGQPVAVIWVLNVTDLPANCAAIRFAKGLSFTGHQAILRWLKFRNRFGHHQPQWIQPGRAPAKPAMCLGQCQHRTGFGARAQQGIQCAGIACPKEFGIAHKINLPIAYGRACDCDTLSGTETADLHR